MTRAEREQLRTMLRYAGQATSWAADAGPGWTADDKTVAASASPRSELWIAPDCGHVRAYSRHPAEREARVLAFLERELGE